MTNLSELSKPVAYDYQIAGACIADGHNENGKWVDWNNKLSRYCPPDWMVEEGKVTELKPLYSQEYVSVLRADAAKWFDAFKKAVSVGARYEERIAELEKRLELVREQRDSELRTNAILEKRLATPVRLPAARFCPAEYEGSLLWSETESYNKAISDCAESLRAAGFVVEGGE
ncbi:hypothetical protein [Serratia nevei]|uniref:hypothetical protein n=1 Tax=Serratia nevei TaxID=2703794 RepID=UPI003FA70064